MLPARSRMLADALQQRRGGLWQQLLKCFQVPRSCCGLYLCLCTAGRGCCLASGTALLLSQDMGNFSLSRRSKLTWKTDTG